MAESERLTFYPEDFKGSRFRCLLATSLLKPKFATWMNSVVQPYAEVIEKEKYMPEGFSQPDEAKLGETRGLLTDGQRECLTSWWLAVRGKANTPNWDFVSTCSIGGRKGLILLEAKAHAGELNPNDSCGAKNEKNRKKIAQAIEEANKGFGNGWSLTPDRCYQLSNRFAWAWKVASLGVPIVLVYLGFLNAYEMPQPFPDHAAWERCLLEYADACVPRSVWSSSAIMVNGTPLIPLIRSADVNVIATQSEMPA